MCRSMSILSSRAFCSSSFSTGIRVVVRNSRGTGHATACSQCPHTTTSTLSCLYWQTITRNDEMSMLGGMHTSLLSRTREITHGDQVVHHASHTSIELTCLPWEMLTGEMGERRERMESPGKAVRDRETGERGEVRGKKSEGKNRDIRRLLPEKRTEMRRGGSPLPLLQHAACPPARAARGG